MDEVDLIEVVFRSEERFRVSLPDDDIGLSSTVSNIVDLIVGRLREQESNVGAGDQRGAEKRSRGRG